jgi:nuclear-control-of-ATPase protein 2
LSTSENLSVASESTEKLHSLLVSLQPPASQDAVDHAIEYLVDRSGDLHVADSQETALKNAVIGQAAVGLYAQALDIYLNEATDIESEAEWWANVERSRVGVAWFLLQSESLFSILYPCNTVLET